MSFPRLTILTIQEQANNPDKKAAINPIDNGKNPIVNSDEKSVFIKSRKAAPRIGIITIKNENRVISFLSVFNSRPVAIVAPLLEMPGITANACASPIHNDFAYVTSPDPFFA